MSTRSMAMLVEPPNGIKQQGKHYYSMWQTLFEIDTKYVPIKPIGRGAYGVVCSSINRETNEKVAIKKIHNVFENRVDALRTLRELKLLRHVRHDNVIALKDVMLPTNKSSFKDVYLVYELMDTDLHQIIKSSQSLSDDHCKYFLFQLLRGLKYLHSANILHRDLKPGNLLVNANCDLKICDFGLARTSQGNEQFMTEYVVTRWYRAPELLLCCDNYGTSIDVWSVGCIFAEILGRKPIFPGTECLNQLKLIINVVGSQQESDIRFIDNPKARRFIKSLPFSRGTHLSNLYPQANPLAIDLLQRMLVFDPTKRISVTDALLHPYMAGLFDPGSNPPAHVPISLDIDENMEERLIREMIWQGFVSTIQNVRSKAYTKVWFEGANCKDITDLHQIIKSSQSLSDDHCKYFLFQLLRGLKYLHSANILHRDLKPGNLLVNANCDLKICDFGLARTSQGNEQFMTEYVVTRWYRAPELLLCCDNYGTSIDVWSVGCIFAEILGRKPIFPGTECLNQLKLIINVVGSQQESDIRFIDNPKLEDSSSLFLSQGVHISNLYPQANPLAIDLLQRMLVFDPTKRISVTDALLHPYMAGLFDPGSNPPAHVPISGHR
ncbi:hypothetical protein Bca52824_031681 [Brassica carinata]|uniref:Mitogen-activated protein kinase n=1 Tax=Brassica carinata TaxID=52824 RepID=A0A8X7V4F5_BRACI|nr:hypothetical protein Bca52824_031681 [Brassica carinata]